MAVRSVDIVAAGPPSADPYDPAAPAWALAAGFVARGADVRVVHPVGPEAAPPPDGVTAVPLADALKHPGAAREPVDRLAAALPRLRPEVELIVRDPLGLGRLGLRRWSRGRPIVAGFVRGLETEGHARAHAGPTRGSVVGRLDVWRDRRSVQRLEAAALAETDLLFFDRPALGPVLARDHGVPERRLVPAPPPVAAAGPVPVRAEARGALRLPADVPIVAVAAPTDDGPGSGVAPAVEAFRRVRPFFPGARLVVVGAAAPAEPGVVRVPERDRASFEGVLAAADVALFLGPAIGFDPGVVLALRAACLPLVGPAVGLPLEPGGLVGRLGGDDPAEAASTLAELLADPALRRDRLTGAAAYAARYAPARVAETVEIAVARLRPAA